MNLSELIAACIAAKEGNKEFALFYIDDWIAEIGNPVEAVMLGESAGEFFGRGSTPEEAVAALLEAIRS